MLPVVKRGLRTAVVDALMAGPEIACGSVLVARATPVLFLVAAADAAMASPPDEDAVTVAALAVAVAAPRRRVTLVCGAPDAERPSAARRMWGLGRLVLESGAAAGLDAALGGDGAAAVLAVCLGAPSFCAASLTRVTRHGCARVGACR